MALCALEERVASSRARNLRLKVSNGSIPGPFECTSARCLFSRTRKGKEGETEHHAEEEEEEEGGNARGYLLILKPKQHTLQVQPAPTIIPNELLQYLKLRGLEAPLEDLPRNPVDRTNAVASDDVVFVVLVLVDPRRGDVVQRDGGVAAGSRIARTWRRKGSVVVQAWKA
ncbi:hypothetical protein WH47_04869 [Habropoda laboriosa]|uniref:Uncharacterized protein n=1 Tax=Habropoda laboriosa TaxID=597456 RepID=A0A0L7QWM6_9HYME|nr:hypothetical protein WH47_04869 [Habropoda laboriosa]